jgi:hypothetical protein
MTLVEELEQAVQKDLAALLTTEAREGAAQALMDWLGQARKLPFADLAQRLEDYRARIQALTASMTLQFDGQRVVVKATGTSERTLKELQYGSDWFEGSDNITETIMTGVTTSGRY